VPRPHSPATAVVVARLHPGTRPESWSRLHAAAERSGGGVTWAADADTLADLTAAAPEASWALLVDAAAVASRRDLRTRLASLARLPSRIDAAACAAEVTPVHRDLLVDAGVRVAAMDRFDDAGRGTRRPAPDGWACRSVVWGLWEVESSAPRGRLGQWFPWGGPAAGSLSLVTVDLDADGRIAEAVLAAAAGRFHDRQGVRRVRLGEVATLVQATDRERGGSVLRAA